MQNPLESYRRTQRELRRQFETFTRANCPACPTPCCRKPARIAPTDILLAEATGWRAKRDGVTTSVTEADSATDRKAASDDAVLRVAGGMANALTDAKDDSATGEGDLAGTPCDFLGERGCTFPTDLRPFGCTTYICRYMYERLDRQSLSRLKRLVRDLEEKHTVLLRTVRPTNWNDE